MSTGAFASRRHVLSTGEVLILDVSFYTLQEPVLLLDASCLQEPVLFLDASCLQEPVLLLDMSDTQERVMLLDVPGVHVV